MCPTASFEHIGYALSNSIEVKQRLLSCHKFQESIWAAHQMIVQTLKAGGKILLAGNGGSAADAQHIAGEFVSRFGFDRPGLPAIALTTDSSVLTAIGNDYGYEKVFSRQIEALCQKNDLVLLFSTSGNSENILMAAKAAREKEGKTVALTGDSGGRIAPLVDLCLKVPSTSTPRIQECHITIGHILCELFELELFGHLAKNLEAYTLKQEIGAKGESHAIR